MNWKLNSDEETILKNVLLWIVQKDVLRAGSETRREKMTQWQTFAGVLGLNEHWANRITDNKARDSFQTLSPARQAQVLVEGVTFDPYKGVLKLRDKVRLDALAIVLQRSDVVPADLPKKLVDEFHWILGRSNRVKARNAVTIGVLGAGAGILTLGMAAPAIGAAIGDR